MIRSRDTLATWVAPLALAVIAAGSAHAGGRITPAAAARAKLRSEIGSAVRAAARSNRSDLMRQVRDIARRAPVARGFFAGGYVRVVGTIDAVEARRMFERSGVDTYPGGYSYLSGYDSDVFVARSQLNARYDDSQAGLLSFAAVDSRGEVKVIGQIVTAVDGRRAARLRGRVKQFREVDAAGLLGG